MNSVWEAWWVVALKGHPYQCFINITNGHKCYFHCSALVVLCRYVTTSRTATRLFFFFFFLCHVARLARLLLRNQSFSSIKRHKKKGKRCLWDEAVIKHSWSLEFWRTGISPCGVQLKPFHKLALHVLWTLIFFSARFHYLLRQARFAPLKIHTHKHAHAHTHNPLYLSLQPLAPWCIPPSPLPLVAGGGRGEKWQAMRNDSGSVCHTVAARSRGF